MKYKIWFQILGLKFIVIIINSCKKHEVPAVTTSAIANVTGTSATCEGTVTDEGTEPVLERGVCWSTGEPSILDEKTIDGIGPGNFISNISDLNPSTN